MKSSASEARNGGGDLKTVWKVKVARLGYCSITWGIHDATPRKKKKKKITLASYPVSILFYFFPVSDVVLHTLALSIELYNHVTPNPSSHSPHYRILRGRIEKLQVTDLNCMWRASPKYIWIALCL